MKIIFNKLKSDKYFYGGLISFTILILFLADLLISAKSSLVSSVTGTTGRYYLLMLLILVNVFFGVKNKRICVLYAISLFVFFAWLSFADSYYSAIDESLHFENINHIVEYNAISTFDDDIDYVFLNEANNSVNSIGKGTNYEAVQAPLYYLILAGVGKFIDSAYIRLHTFRIISLLSVLVIYLFIKKTVLFLEKMGVLIVDHEIFRMGILLTIFSPAYLYRASRLNNEILVCVLCAVLLYVAIVCIIEGYSQKYYLMMSFICVAMFLTKSTAIYAYVVVGAIALMQKKIKQVILPVLTSTLPTIPWFVFNWNTYGSLSAMQEHLDFVLPIVNPNKISQDLFDAFFNILPGTYFSGEEMAMSNGEILWINALFVIALCLIVDVSVKVGKTVKNNGLAFEKYAPKTRINIICTALVLACILCLTMGTISTKICSLRGRYIYATSIAFIYLMLINREAIPVNVKKYVSFIIIVTLGIVTTRATTTFLDRVYSNEHLYGSDISEIVLCDLTDDNWNHGYSRYGNSLLVQITDDNKWDNFQALVGHPVSNGTSAAIITGIDISIVDENKYILLLSNKHIPADEAESNILYVDPYCSIENYNTGATYSVIDNIEEKEIAQSVLIREAGNVWGCSIELATYAVPSYSATAEYKVMDSEGGLLQNGRVQLDGIADNTYLPIYFDSPIPVEKGQKITIALIYDNIENLPLTVRVSDDNSYVQGELYIDGSEVVDQDMGLKLLVN